MINQDKVKEIGFFLEKNKGYQKWGSEKLALKLDCEVDEVITAKQTIKKWYDKIEDKNLSSISNSRFDGLVDEFISSNTNESKITEFDSYLTSQGLTQEDVKSVKFWQTQDGSTRYSVVTNKEQENKLDIESIKDILLKGVEPIQLKEITTKSGKVLVVYLSDKHIGAHTKSTAMYENEYNAQVFQERMIAVFRKIEEYFVSEGTFDKIIVCDLGDSMDGLNGETTRGGHKLPQNMSNTEAFDTFVNVHKLFYYSLFLSGFSAKYEVYHLTNSNHGGEFGYFATRALQEYLNAVFPQVPFAVIEEFITPVYDENFTLLLCHGKDDEDMKNGMPIYLEPKTEKYILDYVIFKGIPTTNLHFIKGDLHQASSQEGKHFRYRNVTSIYGSSKWIMTNFNYTKPGCSFDLFKGKDVYAYDMWF